MKKVNLQLFAEKEALVLRADRLSFMDVSTTGEASYKRMTDFTTMSKSKNPAEYSRKYVDKKVENTDVVGYAEAVEYAFDRHTNNAVHERLANISDKELTGSDTLVNIVTVDLFGTGETATTKPATMRTYSVIPDKSDDGTDALVYSGNFKAATDITEGTATSTDGWQTITFAAAVASKQAN